MLNGLWKLTWIELKVFMREPMGSISTLLLPAILFIVLGRSLSVSADEIPDMRNWVDTSLPVMLTVLIAVNAVTSLATIMSIYREGGILKRLKATPLRPHTILTAHVLVKLLVTAINIATLLIVGKSVLGVEMPANMVGFLVAATLSTISILSLGFVIASVVPTARFAQLITGAVLYPLFAVSGLFTPVENFPVALKLLAYASPMTHAVSLMTGMWEGANWVDHTPELAGLGIAFVVCIALSSRVFRWE